MQNQTALITGAAKRIGAEISRTLHAEGMNIIIHYRSSKDEAEALCNELNALRADSAIILQADLLNVDELDPLTKMAADYWGHLNVLVNNASSFYPTPMGKITEAHWDDLMGSNLKAPLFLSQAATPYLKASQGNIINIVDIHGFRPMKEHPVYCAAKAGLAMLTQSLARELGPEIRVNGVAPGAILWPENDIDEQTQQLILDRTALKRQGEPKDIAATVRFLIRDADYITGQVIPVCGGRSLNI
ncbi:MAG: pteridine reductase [Gammaproteobacteria bacterium]|nr:pteridine reductase [Gammaproteobacteria bacterium]MCW8911107.1 pteridine reductase [Gammaproteobacteria bacterium]MCW9005671.1 pteridine reductase [Gammaproteobacteria bacterium]MCW9055470.1 pteridine reductase [Gammaproteobacteria bacterium]